jgi:multimeric flavodoxin WrbA
MNVIVLHGSARRGGDTDTLAKQFLSGLCEREDHEICHFYPIDMRIEHCRGAECMGCSSGNGCVVEDDMQAVYPAFCAADVVVLATPMFWGYMTSQLKTLFDRFEAICSDRCFGGKDFVLLIGYRHYYGSMVEWLERISNGFDSRCHAVTCRTYDPMSNKDLPVSSLPDKLTEAFELGRSLAALSPPSRPERHN